MDKLSKFAVATKPSTSDEQ